MPTAAATVTVQIHDNGGTANGGVGHQRGADLHDHRHGGQRRAELHRAVRDQTVARRCRGRRRSPAGRRRSAPVPRLKAGQTLNFLVTQQQQRPVLGAAGDLADRHADLHAGRRTRNGSATVTVQAPRQRRHGQRRRRHLARPRPSRSPSRPVNDVPSFAKGADSDGRSKTPGADRHRLGDGHQRGPAE